MQWGNNMEMLYEIAQVPTEGKLFEVKPLEIDRNLFENSREDELQEKTRKIIQEALEEVDKKPERYSDFYTLIPERNWKGFITFKELETYASNCGGEVANWIHQSLEWAQRIYNGESWEDICNNSFVVNSERMILWKNGNYKIVGVTIYSGPESCNCPASSISKYDYPSSFKFAGVVPLVMIRR